jgi:hypothetical protein
LGQKAQEVRQVLLVHKGSKVKEEIKVCLVCLVRQVKKVILALLDYQEEMD